MKKHWTFIFQLYFALNVYKWLILDKYAVAVVKKVKVSRSENHVGNKKRL